MCFAPQRRALFDISTSKSVPKLFTCKRASRHNGVQLFISHLATWPRTLLFSESAFRPPGATNHWKNSESRLSCLFTHLNLLSSETFSFLIFFLLFFSSLTLPISAFHLFILSEVWLLNFLRLCYVLMMGGKDSAWDKAFSNTACLCQNLWTLWNSWISFVLHHVMVRAGAKVCWLRWPERSHSCP